MRREYKVQTESLEVGEPLNYVVLFCTFLQSSSSQCGGAVPADRSCFSTVFILSQSPQPFTWGVV